MVSLDHGIPKISRQQKRRIGEGHGGYLRSQKDMSPDVSVMDPIKSVTQKFSCTEKRCSLPKMESLTARDDKIYR